MMDMDHLVEKQVKLQMTTSHHNYRNFHIKEIFQDFSQKKMSRNIYQEYSKMLKINSSLVESITPVQEHVPSLFYFRWINVILPILEIQELSCIELHTNKNLLLNFLMIINPFDLIKEKEFKGKEGKYIDLLMKVSKLDLLEFGLMNKDQVLLSLVLLEIWKPKE